MVRLRGVCKDFEDVQALRGLDLDLPGGVVGVLGPNGAGKSTLFRVLLGLEAVDAGAAEVLGWPLPDSALRARAEIGYMPEDDCLFPDLRGGEQVVHAARLCGLNRIDAFARAHETLDLVGLSDARYRAVSGYSLGMRQRLRLAMALVHGPRLLLLDEPTAGLDPAGRAEMLSLIAEVGRAGIAILLSTHVLGDVEAVCDHVVLLSRGRAGFNGPMSRFRTGAGRALASEVAEHFGQTLDEDPGDGEPGAVDAVPPGSEVVLWAVEVTGESAPFVAALGARGVPARDLGLAVQVELSNQRLELLWEAASEVGLGVRRLEPQQEGMAEAFVRHLRLDDPTRRQAGTRGNGRRP